MITQNDIKILNDIFATKKELQDVKSELKAEMIAMRVTLKREIKSDMETIASTIIKEIREIKTNMNMYQEKITHIKTKQEESSIILETHSANWKNVKQVIVTM